MVEGKYQFKNKLPFIPGLEACGIIIEQNCNKSTLVGKKVIVHGKNGGFSEEIVTDYRNVIIIDKQIKSYIAAGFYVAYLTAYISLIEIAKAKKKQTMLITGASGGIGNALILLGNKIGMDIFVVTKNNKKKTFFNNFNIKYCLTEKDNIKEKIIKLTCSKRLDIIADVSGLQKKQNLLGCLKFGGKYLIIGFMDGNFSNIKTNYILIKGLEIFGVRAGEYVKRNFKNNNNRIIKSLISILKENINSKSNYSFYEFNNLKKALKAIKSRKSRGKVIIKTKYYKEI